jgi:hypothetical protein
VSADDSGSTKHRKRAVAMWIVAPLLAFIAFGAWALASPVGAGPDDDFHLVSIWCANGGSDLCKPGSKDDTRQVSAEFPKLICYVVKSEESAACQDELWPVGDEGWVETDRGNFYGEYPPIYYATMRLLAGPDVEASAVGMRLFNAALFVAIATALAALLPRGRQRTLLWGWLVTVVPLGLFVIASNNPSGWALTGVGTAFLALLGWFETYGARKWSLGALYMLGILMAAGSRGDAAVYAIGATVTVMILTASTRRDWLMSALLPAAGLAVAAFFFATAGQAGVATGGFTNGNPDVSVGPGLDSADGLSGLALAAYNLLMLPFLWTGVWGSWALGWLDTSLPAIVPWAATAAFIVVGFAGLGQLTWRKATTIMGVLAVLIVLPVHVLTAGGDLVGENLQPRYLLPLIALFVFVLITEPAGRVLRFTRVQTFAVLMALAIANLVALQVNIRRYVTGIDAQAPNLDAGAEWWWHWLPMGPMAVWVLGALAYAGLLASLWPSLRNNEVPAPAPAAALDDRSAKS